MLRTGSRGRIGSNLHCIASDQGVGRVRIACSLPDLWKEKPSDTILAFVITTATFTLLFSWAGLRACRWRAESRVVMIGYDIIEHEMDML